MNDINELIGRLKLKELAHEYERGLYLKAATTLQEMQAENKQLWITNSELRGQIHGTCNMCNWIERDICSSEKESLKQRIVELEDERMDAAMLDQYRIWHAESEARNKRLDAALAELRDKTSSKLWKDFIDKARARDV